MSRCNSIDKIRSIAQQRLIDADRWGITEEDIREEMNKMLNEYNWGK